MATTPRPLADITDEALRLLNAELGTTDTLRFLCQFTKGHGDYTEDRKTLFGGKSLEDIINAIRDGQDSN